MGVAIAVASDILAAKGVRVHSTRPEASALDAVEQMNREKIGALLVLDGGPDGGKLVGMFTERDVLRRVLGDGRNPAETRVFEVMTHEVHCCTPDTDLEDLGRLMQEKRIRHIPVCDAEGHVMGMISIGDINAHYVSQQESHIAFLSDYIYGRA